MYKIKLLNDISPVGLSVLKPDKFECSPDMENPDAIIVRSYDMHSMDIPKSVLAVARAGAGVNNIPIDKLSQKGIVVFNTPGANANAVRELLMAAMLLSTRKIFSALNWVQGLKGQSDIAKLAEKEKSRFLGPELRGKKLGVIGLGAIGIRVCNMAHSFGMDVYGYDPFLSVDAAWRVSRGISHSESIDEIFQECDFITLHVPFTKETENLISADNIAKMKNGVRLFNFARAELVDNSAIIAAVKSEKIKIYATDFASEELIGYPEILIFPHLGASTPESEENCARMAASEVKEFLQNGNITNSVNLPDTYVRRHGRPRVTVFHKNIPNMLSAILNIVGEKNISNLINNSKDEYAYTVIDLDEVVSDEIIKGINDIEGVIRVQMYEPNVK